MKKLLIVLLVLCTTTMFSQKKMVLITGFTGNEINVTDSVSKSAVEEFRDIAEQYHFNFSDRLNQLQNVRVINTGENQKTYIYNRRIYITDKANNFPNTKRILILNGIGQFYGVPTNNDTTYNVMNEDFILDEVTEKVFTERRKENLDIIYLMGKIGERLNE